MSVFPFMQKIDGKRFLVIGSGAVACRKARLILQFTDQLTIITHSNTSPNASPIGEKLREFSLKGAEILDRSFTPKDLEKADYVIASTDNQVRNHEIADLCRRKGLPVNVPDDPENCSFFMPSVIKKDSLLITVSTEGKSPAMSAYLRRRIEDLLPDRTEKILDRMAELRTWIPQKVTKSKDRGRLYADLLAELMDGRLEPAEDAVSDAALAWIRLNSAE